MGPTLSIGDSAEAQLEIFHIPLKDRTTLGDIPYWATYMTEHLGISTSAKKDNKFSIYFFQQKKTKNLGIFHNRQNRPKLGDISYSAKKDGKLGIFYNWQRDRTLRDIPKSALYDLILHCTNAQVPCGLQKISFKATVSYKGALIF